jgi:hypothetical protein
MAVLAQAKRSTSSTSSRKELFEGVLKWDMGVNFQIVALQAVMAELLGGDTIHHACGIPVFNGRECHDEDLQTHLAIAKRVLQWRWLIIDEISMVSAKLLAELDVKLRKVVREIGTAKISASGIDRPFGGLNVIVCGDWWQLDPPDRGFLASVPSEYIQDARKYKPTPTVAHGQSLLWSGAETGIAGVSELVQCERCDDVWLRELQEQMRHGRLSEDNHKFLHGEPTTVPGSWEEGDVKCGRAKCRALVKKHPATPSADQEILQKECKFCTQERASKRLVLSHSNDQRLEQPNFCNAPAIFANNDIKYDTNKQRARKYATA